MAWLQPQLTRERPDTFVQTAIVIFRILAFTGLTIHFGQASLSGQALFNSASPGSRLSFIHELQLLQPPRVRNLHLAVLAFQP